MKSDNKNTLLAFLLIGLLLIGFSIYNNKRAREFEAEQARIRHEKDSIAAVEAKRIAAYKAVNPASADSSAASYAGLDQEDVARYKNDFFNAASHGTEQRYTLENENVKISFTNKGAKFVSAQIKNYTTHEGKDLVLFDGPENDFSLSFYAGEEITTSEMYFEVTEPDPGKSVSFKLPVDSLSYIEYVYTLAPQDYRLGLAINMQGMDRYIRRNETQLDLHWKMDVLRQEKGYDNEKNYSAVVYHYPDSRKVETIGQRKASGKAAIKSRFEWVAYQQQFFSAICLSPDNFSGGDLSMEFYQNTDGQNRLMHCESAMWLPYKSQPAQHYELEFFFLPNRFYSLKAYDHHFEKLIPLGGSMISWINRYVIIPIFNFLSKYIGNFGIIILIMTILLKIVISPLTFKSYMSTAKMRALKPEIEKINARYPKDADKLKKQQATMDLYKRSGVSMFGGCLPMLMQFPVLWAMFRFFPASIELRQQGFLWCHDLSTYDSILSLGFKIPLYGDHVSLFALLTAVTMFWFSRMTLSQQPTDNAMPGMKTMSLYFMPVMMLFICNNLSSGLSYYYMLSNLLTMLQTWITRRFIVNEAALYARLKAKSEQAAPVKKSRWQQRLEEMQKRAEQMQKQSKQRR